MDGLLVPVLVPALVLDLKAAQGCHGLLVRYA